MPKIVDPEQRRTEIIHGLWAVIYERGIHAVTYQAVAQAAGVSVGRIQHYFDSKQDLVHAGCRAMVEGAAGALAELAVGEDALGQAHRAVEELGAAGPVGPGEPQTWPLVISW